MSKSLSCCLKETSAKRVLDNGGGVALISLALSPSPRAVSMPEAAAKICLLGKEEAWVLQSCSFLGELVWRHITRIWKLNELICSSVKPQKSLSSSPLKLSSGWGRLIAQLEMMVLRVTLSHAVSAKFMASLSVSVSKEAKTPLSMAYDTSFLYFSLKASMIPWFIGWKSDSGSFGK